MKKILFLVIVCTFFLPAALRAETDQQQPVPREDLAGMLKKLEAPFSEMASISYNVKRERNAINGKLKDSWSFTLRNPADVRIEYKSPRRRSIIINKNEMWEYLPDSRAVMRTDFSKKTSSEKDSVVAMTLARVSINGLRPGDYSHLLGNITEARKSGNIVTIKGEKKPRFMLKIDTDKNVLLASEIYDNNGKLKLRTSSSAHKEVEKGFWLPSRIKSAVGFEDQYIEDVVKISEITVNKPFPNNLFSFKKPKNVKLLESGSN